MKYLPFYLCFCQKIARFCALWLIGCEIVILYSKKYYPKDWKLLLEANRHLFFWFDTVHVVFCSISHPLLQTWNSHQTDSTQKLLIAWAVSNPVLCIVSMPQLSQREWNEGSKFKPRTTVCFFWHNTTNMVPAILSQCTLTCHLSYTATVTP